jgi:hypothetical protein
MKAEPCHTYEFRFDGRAVPKKLSCWYWKRAEVPVPGALVVGQ